MNASMRSHEHAVRGPARAFQLHIQPGIALRDLAAHARRLGATVEEPRRTGELRFSHPCMARPITCNGRRKDASRAAIGWVRRLAEITSTGIESTREAA